MGGTVAPRWVEDAYYIVGRSSDVSATPRAVELLGRPIVVYRQHDGRPAALLDRCPHRNVPLSLGRVQREGLVCAYHGWRFDGDGRCNHIPGLCERIPPLARVDAFATHERDGWVYVYGRPGVTPETPPPPPVPFVDDRRYTRIFYVRAMNAPMVDVAENALDVPHTAFLHRGLFRGSGARRRLEIEVREGSDYVEAEYFGETAPKGLLGRVLAPSGGAVRHVDRFRMPSVAEVEYQLGEVGHVVSTVWLTPHDATRCTLYAQLAARLPLPAALVEPVARPIVMRVLDQDAAILEAQVATVARFGGRRFVSTSLDVLGGAIERLVKSAAEGALREPGAPRRITMEV